MVLASFNNIYKITPEMLSCWLRILRRAERAVLWLLDDNPWATAALRAQAAAAGLDPARLMFSARSTHAEYREKLTLADVYLDTYPYNAGSTARDVLDAGVPLVTMSGRTSVSRMAGSLLNAAGLEELVTTSWDDYETLAVELCARRPAAGGAQGPDARQRRRLAHGPGALHPQPRGATVSIDDRSPGRPDRGGPARSHAGGAGGPGSTT